MCTSDEAVLKNNFGESKPSSKLTLKKKYTTVVAAMMILEVLDNWKSMLHVNILKKKRLWTLITFRYRICMLPLQSLSDWCLHGVYVWHKFQKKNIPNWVIIWIKFKDFGYFKCSTVPWLLLHPSCKGNSLTRVDSMLQAQIVTWRPI